MARTPMVAGNWKMNMTAQGARDLILAIRDGGRDIASVEQLICPPYLFLAQANELCAGTDLKSGAQNMHWEEKGAFTGEISPLMLQGLVEYVIIGHSERRQYFAETDETVNKKVVSAIAHGLKPIVCVGETGPQRQAGETDAVLRRQVRGAFEGVETPAATVVAYEPVWAIGTGVAATSADAEAACAFIRAELAAIIGEARAAELRILYGGSVTPANIAEYVSHPNVDGGLVGGASLVADSFLAMCRAAVAGGS